MIHTRHRTALSRFLERRTAVFYNVGFSAMLALGGVMDYFLTGLWFPRAGAIVAGVAAYVYFFDPRTTDDWWQIRAETRRDILLHDPEPLRKYPDPVMARAQSIAHRKAMEQLRIARSFYAMAEQRKITYRQAKEVHQHAHDLALRVQACWLFIGTLIWAFGDIPVELLKCGRVPC